VWFLRVLEEELTDKLLEPEYVLLVRAVLDAVVALLAPALLVPALLAPALLAPALLVLSLLLGLLVKVLVFIRLFSVISRYLFLIFFNFVVIV
jgi:hypothetical protein